MKSESPEVAFRARGEDLIGQDHLHDNASLRHAASTQDLDIARELINAGVPVFLARPSDNDLGFKLPTGWEKTTPDPAVLDRWRPGDALCAVGGVVCDFVDVDPRNGGDDPAKLMMVDGNWPHSYGKAVTPSGGTHDIIAPLGIRKAKREGIDYQGGDLDGNGRGFVFIAPTVRPSKITGEMVPYRWTKAPNLEALRAAKGIDKSGAHFTEWVTTKPSSNGQHNGTGHSFELPEVIEDGHRDETLFRYASSLLARVLPRGEAETLMRYAWQRCDQPPQASDYYPVEKALEKLNRYEPGRSEGYEKKDRNGQEEPSVGRHLIVTKASDKVMKATRWLWEDNRDHWVPMGELTGLTGREGVGKSTWTGHLTAKVTRGLLPGDFYGEPKGVVIVSTEDSWEATIQPRLVAAGVDLELVFHIQAVDADGLKDTVSLPRDLAEFERAIREYDVALVILDPLLTLINKKLDTHKDAEIRQALDPLVRVAHDTRCAFIGLIHVNKSSEGDLMNRVMGSRAITAVVRAVLFCGSYKPIEDQASDSPFGSPGIKRARFVFGQIKNNLQAKVMKSIEYHFGGQTVGYDEEAQKDIDGSYLVIDSTHPENVEDIILEQEKRAKATKTGGSKAEGWLVAYLTGRGEVPSNQVLRDAAEAGLSRNQVYAGKNKLGERIQVKRVAEMHSGTVWVLIPENQTSGTSGTSGDEWDESDVLASHLSGLSRKSDEWKRDEWNQVQIGETWRFVTRLIDLTEARGPEWKHFRKHPVCDGCGADRKDTTRFRDTWKHDFYVNEDGIALPLCSECIHGDNPDPRFIWHGDVPEELRPISPKEAPS